MSRLPVAARLLIAATLALALALPVAGLLLQRAFERAVTDAFDDRLVALAQRLVAAAEVTMDGGVAVSRALGEPRFEQLFSGWYWQITAEGERLAASRSLADVTLPTGVPGLGEAAGPRDEALRRVALDVSLPRLQDRIRVTVAADLSELNGEVARFGSLLAASLTGLALLLLIATALQLAWGLAPLRRMLGDLRAVRAGDTDRLPVPSPADLAEVAGEMNAVLARQEALIERGRSTAGNLAHALKTPLAVLKARAHSLPPDLRPVLAAEVTRIEAAIRHHLDRAGNAARSLHAQRVEVAVAVEPVVRAISMLTIRRGLAFEAEIPDGLRVRFDPQDLQEVAGNLLENAVAHARTTVRLAVHAGDGWRLGVEDDGPGLDDAVLAAGPRRGDTGGAGNGLGLAIVGDIAALYGGRLELARSPLGGLLAQVRFPAGSSGQRP